MSSRDIKLQVNIAVLLYDVVQDDRLITLMIRRLEDLTNDIDLGKQLNIHEGDKLGTQLVQLSFRPGVLILAVKVGLQVPLLEKSTMWICENAATVSPIMIKAYSRRLKDVSITDCQKFFVQPFNRLLLRSSGLALGILQELTLPDSIILEGDFADSLWLVMTSENDENRQRASKLLSKVGDSMGLMKRVESVFTGKSIKVKKSMLQLLKEVLSRGAPPLSSALGLRRFLEKETNEEIVYWIVSCLISAGESGEALIKEALAINKSPCRVCWFSAIAELGMSEADASAVMAKKDDPLITLLATIDSIPPTTTMLKTVGLSPQLQLAALQDCLSKYPLIPIWKIIRLLSILKGEPELCKQLWRSIIILYMANPKLRQKFEAELSSSTVPVNPLAACREELLTRPTITQGLIINSVKTAQDLLAMVSITNESEYKQLNLWGHLVDHLRSKDSLSLSSEIVLPVALASHSPMVLRAIADTFPMVAKALVEHSLTILASYDKVEPSEEDLKILNTPDDQLPIVDGKILCKSPNPPLYSCHSDKKGTRGCCQEGSYQTNHH